MILIDKLCYTSKLRYINAGEKFAFSMLTLIFCVVSRSAAMGFFIIALTSFLTVHKGGISFKRYCKLMMIPLFFLFCGTAAIIVNISATPFDAFMFPIGSYYITGSRDAIFQGFQLIITAMAAVSCLYFLSLNTTMTDILAVLRKLHCPPLLSELMLLIYRYIFLLLDIAYFISLSQDSRLGHKDFPTSLRSFAALAQTLFIRATEKSRVLYDAMEARCYDGEIHVLEENRPASKKHIAAIIFFESFLLAVTLYIRLF